MKFVYVFAVLLLAYEALCAPLDFDIFGNVVRSGLDSPGIGNVPQQPSSLPEMPAGLTPQMLEMLEAALTGNGDGEPNEAVITMMKSLGISRGQN